MSKVDNNRITSNKDKLSLIKCECGAEILLIPDLKAMGIAIEEHAEQHKSKIADAEKAEAEADRIRNLLIMQVLLKAAKSKKAP